MKIRILRNGLIMSFALMATIALSSCDNQKKTQTTTTPDVVIVEDGDRYDFNVYTYEQRDQAITGAKAELDRLNRQIDEMKADLNEKSANLSAEAKANYEKAIADLEAQRDAYKTRVNELENATKENWDQAKRDIGNAYNDVANGIERGWKNFKEGVSDVATDVKEGVNKAADDVKDAVK